MTRRAGKRAVKGRWRVREGSEGDSRRGLARRRHTAGRNRAVAVSSVICIIVSARTSSRSSARDFLADVERLAESLGSVRRTFGPCVPGPPPSGGEKTVIVCASVRGCAFAMGGAAPTGADKALAPSFYLELGKSARGAESESECLDPQMSCEPRANRVCIPAPRTAAPAPRHTWPAHTARHAHGTGGRKGGRDEGVKEGGGWEGGRALTCCTH